MRENYFQETAFFSCGNPNARVYWSRQHELTQPNKKMKKELETKITALLALDSPANYMCWEDAEESILDELTDEEAEEYTNEGCSMVEEWFAANEEENDEESFCIA